MFCSLFEGRGGATVTPRASSSSSSSFLPSSSSSSSRASPPSPVVIYAHCNSGSRRDAEEVLGLLLPAGIAVAALDFSGSGLSEGGHVSLGAREAEDLADLVEFLAEERGPGCGIAIWGRSMGAVAALLAASAEAREAAAAVSSSAPPAPSLPSSSSSSSSPKAAPSTKIAAVVLDSPFSSLPELMAELVAKQRLLPFPKAFLSPRGLLLGMMARSVRRRAGFDLREVVPLRAVSGGGLSSPSCTSRSRGRGGSAPASGVGASPPMTSSSLPEATRLFASLLPPALFGHAEDDSFISSAHSRKLHAGYLGAEKALCAFGGDHNSARPASFRSAALGFLKEVLFFGDKGSRNASATAATAAMTNDEERKTQLLLSSSASLGAATAFDTALLAAAPDHHSFGAVASGHAADERESWGRAASAVAFAAAAAVAAGRTGALLSSSFGKQTEEEEEEQEVLEMERAIAASLELTCAEAEREAREAREAALAAAAAAAAADQLQREKQRRDREQRGRRPAAAAAVTHRSSFAPPAYAALEEAPISPPAAPAAAPFDLTPDQRELHAFFSPPSPTAEGSRQREREQGRQAAAAAAAASKRQLTLPKVPLAVSSSFAAASRRNASVEARAGGWKS